MNRYIRWEVLSLITAFAFCACTPEETFENEDVLSPEIEGTASGDLIQMEFSGQQDDSRTFLSGSNVIWNGGDKIAVLDAASPYVHQFDNTDAEGGAVCRFTGEAKAGETTWYVIYPMSAAVYDGGLFFVDFPKTQKAVAGGFADGAYLTAAKTTSKNFEMKALSSLVKINIGYENIKKVTLEARDGSNVLRPLSGRYQLNRPNLGQNDFAEHPWISYLGGSYSRDGVDLVPPDGSDHIAPGTYYLSVASFEAAGLEAITNTRLIFTRTDDETASRSTTASWMPGQGTFLDLSTLSGVDDQLSWRYFDICFGTSAGEFWPFTQYRLSADRGDHWGVWKNQPATLSTILGLDVQYKLKDSGHLLTVHAEEEQVRYATEANAFYPGGEVGDFIEFPGLNNRYLKRIEVFYDSTYVNKSETGWPYCKGRPASECPHIQDTSGDDISYVLIRRNENGFHHCYDLFDTSVGAAYRYVQAIDGGEFKGPRIQRIRLYYSDELGEDGSLALPASISASGYSTSLRRSTVNINLTTAGERMAGASAYDVGIVVRNMRRFAHAVDTEYPDGHQWDSVIFFNNTDPTLALDGVTLHWEMANIHTYNNDRLNLEYEFYPFVRIKGDDTNPVTMTPGTAGTNWRAGSPTWITRPVYTWTEDNSTNYLYSSDTQVKLKATVNIKSPAAQRYDVGFIYREEGAGDSGWNYAFLDQNGLAKGSISGYWFDGDTVSGRDTTITATITGLISGQAYEYKPIVMQHAACFYGYDDEDPSTEASQFTYIPYADGYNHSNNLITDINGPVPTITGDSGTATGTYLSATTGKITIAGTATTIKMDVTHVDPSIRGTDAFITGFVYNNGSTINTRVAKVLPAGSSPTVSGAIVYSTTSANSSPSTLVSLPDTDNATVSFCPFFAFVKGGVGGVQGVPYTPSGYSGSFTCPVVSTPTSGDYLWRGVTSADLMGTIAISNANCEMEIGYSTDGGENWTTATQNLTAGSKTISSATVAEGAQTVKFGARRSGSSDASTWKALDVSLAHPISSVTTYASTFYDSRTTATIAGSFTTNKVASNDLVEYGFYYVEIDGTTSHYEKATAPAAAQAYYTIDITDGVADATDRAHRLLGYFFARLYGSTSIPAAKESELNSSKSGGMIMTHSWADALGYDKRLYVNFNENPRSSSSYRAYPFLPHSSVDSDYIDDLSNTYGRLCQDKKALLTGGQTLEFHMTSGLSVASAHAVISGACCNNAGSGRMRVFAASADDYILLPGIPGYKIRRVCAWLWGGNVSPSYWDDSEATGVVYAFLTSDEDYDADAHTPHWVSASGATATSFADDMKNWNDGLAEDYLPFDTYKGQSLRLHFAGKAVSVKAHPNGYLNYPTGTNADPDRTEVRCPGFWIDYVDSAR